MTSVIFLGTPDFAVPILEGLIAQHYDVVAVMTQPDRKVGRKQKLAASPVKQAAVAHNIPVLQPEKLSGSPELAQAIALAPDLIVTAAYGQFLQSYLYWAVICYWQPCRRLLTKPPSVHHRIPRKSRLPRPSPKSRSTLIFTCRREHWINGYVVCGQKSAGMFI